MSIGRERILRRIWGKEACDKNIDGEKRLQDFELEEENQQGYSAERNEAEMH